MNENPFLDQYNQPDEGKVSIEGNPLNRIFIPDIETLVSENSRVSRQLPSINIQSLLAKAGQTPVKPAPFNGNTGIMLDVNLTKNEGSSLPENVNLGGTYQTGVKLPTTLEEARDKLALIVPERAGRNGKFGVNHLQQIARNLGIESHGNKAAIANRIRSAVITHFNLFKENI